MNASWANLNLKHYFEAPREKKATEEIKPAIQEQEQDNIKPGIQQRMLQIIWI